MVLTHARFIYDNIAEPIGLFQSNTFGQSETTGCDVKVTDILSLLVAEKSNWNVK